MSVRLHKTDAGREAIRRRDAELSRAARNLLLIVDASRPAEAWLAAVAGAQAQDLERLLALGYVAETTAAARTVAPAAALPSEGALDAALQRLEPRMLYDLLTAEARPRLGLVKGYRMVLDVERSGGPDELRRLALRFVAELQEGAGAEAARAFCRRLGATV
ncbi:hypothetical protein CLD22_19020 [Rubrivivax gelatinosus]|nr:hypothetical protein [Rubrivivax gelatinosus]